MVRLRIFEQGYNLIFVALLIFVFFSNFCLMSCKIQKSSYTKTVQLKRVKKKVSNYDDQIRRQILLEDKTEQVNLKYILLWSLHKKTLKLESFRKGQTPFLENRCKFSNCFITDGSNFISGVDKYDAVLFNSNDEFDRTKYKVPKLRSPHQKYVFVANEPKKRTIIYNPIFDNFFNWTWTYRLDSDIVWRYIDVVDMKGKIVGPSSNVTWPAELEPINKELKAKLDKKTKAVAWFTSTCKGTKRDLVRNISIELQKSGYTVDIFGRCPGDINVKADDNSLLEMLRNDYYFYFAFEEFNDIDYVTKELLIPLNNYAVPIIFGISNYSRILPNGSYLDVKELGEEIFSNTLVSIMKNKTAYYDFFRWKNHYIYKAAPNNNICELCKALNNKEIVMKKTVHHGFRDWWNRMIWTKVYDKMVENTNVSLQELRHEVLFILKKIDSLEIF